MVISILIPFYDKDHQHFPTILSYLEKLSFKKEVIFVDDRNDKTEDIRAKYNIPNNYKIVNSFKTGENVGTFEARKTAIRAATGDYIWFIDIDDEPIPIDLKIDETNLKDIYIYNTYEYILDEQCNDENRLNSFYKLKDFDTVLNNDNVVVNIKMPKTLENGINYKNIFLNFMTTHAFIPLFILWDKIIKRDLAIKAVNRTDLEKNFCVGEDTVLMNLIYSSADELSIQFNTSYFYKYNISTRDKYQKFKIKETIPYEKLKKSHEMKLKYIKPNWTNHIAFFEFDNEEFGDK